MTQAKCTQCDRGIPSGFRACPYCGHPRVPSGETDKPVTRGRRHFPSTTRSQSIRRSETEVLSQDMEHDLPVTTSESELFAALTDDADCLQLLLGEIDEDVRYAEKVVRRSPFVLGNHQYVRRMAETTILYAEYNDTINASASDYAGPEIRIYAGEARFSRLIAIGLDRLVRHNDIQVLMQNIIGTGIELSRNGGELSLKLAAEILLNNLSDMNDTTLTGEIRELTQVVLAATLAHEIGHIALGHTFGGSLSDEISRNMEREADSFASSLLSQSPLSEYLALGQVFSWVAVVWQDFIVRPDIPYKTHPPSVQRLRAIFRDNEQAVRRSGLTWSLILGLLPEEIQKRYKKDSHGHDTVPLAAKRGKLPR